MVHESLMLYFLSQSQEPPSTYTSVQIRKLDLLEIIVSLVLHIIPTLPRACLPFPTFLGVSTHHPSRVFTTHWEDGRSFSFPVGSGVNHPWLWTDFHISSLLISCTFFVIHSDVCTVYTYTITQLGLGTTQSR